MIHTRRTCLRGLCTAALTRVVSVAAQPDFPAWPDADKERLLQTGKVVSVEDIGHGVTKPVRARLVLGGVEHAAQIQTVNKELPDFFPPDGGRPVPMIDSWRFNIAAYKIDRLLGLKMVPPAVARPFRGKSAAFSWWVDEVQFEEVERVRKDIAPPDAEAFERQRDQSRVFDELVLNIDRNLSNLLITTNWKLALIDHSRSFIAYPGIRNEGNLKRCSRPLINSLKGLTRSSVQQAAGKYLTLAEVDALLGRRDKIISFFGRAARDKGEENVYFS